MDFLYDIEMIGRECFKPSPDYQFLGIQTGLLVTGFDLIHATFKWKNQKGAGHWYINIRVAENRVTATISGSYRNLLLLCLKCAGPSRRFFP